MRILVIPMDWSTPASFAHGDFQARILQWVSMLSSKGSSQPRDWAQVFHIEDRFFTIWGIREALILRSNDSLQPHGLSHTRLPCPSLSPRVCSKSCPLSQWCHPTISFSVIPLLLLPSVFPRIRIFFQWIGSSHQVVKVFELHHQSFQWIFWVDIL